MRAQPANADAGESMTRSDRAVWESSCGRLADPLMAPSRAPPLGAPVDGALVLRGYALARGERLAPGAPERAGRSTRPPDAVRCLVAHPRPGPLSPAAIPRHPLRVLDRRGRRSMVIIPSRGSGSISERSRAAAVTSGAAGSSGPGKRSATSHPSAPAIETSADSLRPSGRRPRAPAPPSSVTVTRRTSARAGTARPLSPDRARGPPRRAPSGPAVGAARSARVDRPVPPHADPVALPRRVS